MLTGEEMKRFFVVLVALGWAAISTAAAQQGKAPWEEFENRLKDSQSVSALGPDLFGDNVGLSDGGLSFAATDVDLAGNDKLRVALSRKYVVSNRWDYISDSPLADWELDVPRISGIFAPNWTVSNPTPSVARCSNMALPTQPLRDYYARDFWHGNVLSLPDGGGGELLLPSSQLPAPTTGENYIWTTSDHVRIACLPQTKNATGEGFLAITPDGTRYWFDWMAQYHEPLLVMTGRKEVLGAFDENPVQRRKNVLYATKVQDRFGNTVNYTYTNAWNAPAVLTTIAASDGRRIDITYASGNISTVHAGTQTWTYTYGNTSKGQRTLTAVRQPDLSQWTIGFAAFTDAYMEYRVGSTVEAARTCIQSELPINVLDEPIATIKHPSGAVGRFRVGIRTHGRSGVPINCENVTTTPGLSPGTGNDTNDDMNLHPVSYDSFTLLDKEISGAGVATQQWSYAYTPNVDFFLTEGASVKYPVCSLYNDPVRWKECHAPRCQSDECASASETTVVGSDGSWMRYRHGNSYLYNEGKLLSVEQGSSASNVLRSVMNTYDLSLIDKVYPALVGLSLRPVDEGFSAQHTRPLTQSVTTQDGATFSATSTGFDVFARPLATTQSSSLGYSRNVGTTYSDNLAKWVLGQVARTTTNGIEVSKSVYDSATALPLQSYVFGKLEQSFTWDTAPGTQAGTLKSLRDGNSNLTTLGNWKRGLPQLITFPATVDQPTAVSRTAVVNDDGRIASVTNENAFSTAYGYDAMGRLATIAYPIGDSVAWTNTLLTFAPTAAAYGLPADHWQQTVRTGNGYKVVHYDAMWRPVVEEAYDSGNLAGTRSIIVQRYDAKGRLAFRSYPLRSLGSFTDTTLKGVRTEYDALDRVTAVKQDSELGLLTTTSKYLPGFKTQITSPKHQGTPITTETSYQAWDQPTTAYPVAITAPEGAYTDIVRDAFGKPKSIKRRNGADTVSITRSYVYDTISQQLCKTIEPETGSTLMGYDPAGNLSWSASGQNYPSTVTCELAPVAVRTTRAYDSRNRLKALLFPDSRGNIHYSYAPDNLPTAITSDNGGVDLVSTTYAYNKRRLITSERMQLGGIDWALGYGYNANGHLAAHSHPNGLSVTYLPNARGQATQAGTYATGVTYHPNGGMAGFTYGNARVHTLTQNMRQLPERSQDSGGILDDSYDYDGNGNVIAISDGLSGNRSNRDMTYDHLDRLTGTTSPMFVGGTLYSYDALDNLVRVKAPGRDHTYLYDPNWRLTNVTNTGGPAVIGLGYDAQGNLNNKNGQLFDFDYGNRLREATGREVYSYDGHGRRVRATHPTLGSIYSMYGQDGALRYQRDERKGVAVGHITLNGSLVAQVKDVVAPAVPALSAPTYVTTGSYTVSWSTVVAATRYELQEQVNGGSWMQVASGTATATAISGKASGIYAYRVRACNGSECGGWSAVASVAVELPPDAIPTLTVPATSTTGGYTVSWTAPGGSQTFTLQESANGGAWTTAYTGAALSKAYAGKVAGGYGYRIQACNPAGCTGMSATKTVTVVFTPTAAPTVNVPATTTTGSYTVSWNAIATAASYQLEQQVNGGTWAQVYAAAATSMAFTGVAPAVYGYRARACNVAGCGPFSAVATITRQPTAAPVLIAPATSLTGSYTVSWNAVAAATSYQLEERLGSGSWLLIHNAGAISAAVTGKAAGTYGYRVRGCNAAGCGPYSALDETLVSAVSVITAAAANSTGSYAVSWTGVATATSYRLEERVNSGAWTQIQDSAATSASRTGKIDGTYGYRVRGCDAAGCGAYSAEASVVVTLPPAIPPVPTGLDAYYTYISLKTRYRFSWNASPDATYYEVSPGSLGYSGSLLSFLFVRNGTPIAMSFQVRACNPNGCSAWSAVVQAHPL